MTHTAQHDLLHLAAMQDNAVLVRKLLAAGHQVGTCDTHDNTALHIVSAHGATAALRALLQEVAKTSSSSDDASSHAGVRSTLQESPQQKGGAGRPRRRLPSGRGDHPVHVDSTNVSGWTPLMQAARYGRSEALDLLLEFGASVSVLDCLETNVLALAAASGDVASVRSLIRAGASATAGQTSRFNGLLHTPQIPFVSFGFGFAFSA